MMGNDMLRDWMKRNFWRSKFMFRFAQKVSKFQDWLWRKMNGREK